MNTPNRNALWAKLLVDELAYQGLTTVSVAPGSRSTPLTLAFYRHDQIDVFLHHDERCAAFFALGAALAGDRPVALVCTSGTAAANFYPAVVEAFHAHAPLIVLTADRPHDQRYAGANQAIDQVNLYGSHALWSVDVAPPEANAPDRALRYLRALAARAFATANGFRKGPVHLNVPFRKPLEPTFVEADQPSTETQNGVGYRGRDQAFTQMETGAVTPTPEQIERLAQLLNANRKGLIVCGPRCPGGEFPQAVTLLAKQIGYPVLADPLSGVRFGPHVSEMVLGGFETFLRAEVEPPEVVLRFGAMPTSKHLGQRLAGWTQTRQFAVSAHGCLQDPTYSIDQFLWVNPTLLCLELSKRINSESIDSEWTKKWQHAESICASEIQAQLNEQWMEETVVRDVVEQLPDPSSLYIANSLPVRHLDQFVAPNTKQIGVFGNRGASGIDGTVSSAAGAAALLDAPLVLVTGDLAFYHDLNGLLALKHHHIHLTMVVVNNDGGGIFRRLPISEYEPPFNELFATPHGLTFESAAELYGLNYKQVTQRAAFQQAFIRSLTANNATIIEAPFDGERNHRLYQSVTAAILNRLEQQGGL